MLRRFAVLLVPLALGVLIAALLARSAVRRAALSAALCLAFAALWITSYWYCPSVGITSYREFRVDLTSYTGVFALYVNYPGPLYDEHPEYFDDDRGISYRDEGVIRYTDGAFAEEWGEGDFYLIGLTAFCSDWEYPRTGPDKGRFHLKLSTPYWFLIVLTAVLPLRWFLIRLRRRERESVGLCPGCGHDLRASDTACPECGRVRPAQSSPPLAPGLVPGK